MSYFDESYTTGRDFTFPDTLMLLRYLRVAADIRSQHGDPGRQYGLWIRHAPRQHLQLRDEHEPGDVYLGRRRCRYAESLRVRSENRLPSTSVAGCYDIGGLIGNVWIALGAVIENVVGGSGPRATSTFPALSTNNLVNGSDGIDPGPRYVQYRNWIHALRNRKQPGPWAARRARIRSRTSSS